MNKTVSIHIKGFPFIMEEIAFNRLETYIKRLKQALGNQEGAEEIVEDIEIRIAELLNEKSTNSKTVIEDKDVVDVLNTLGDPSDYADADESTFNAEQESHSSTYEQEQGKQERRLYRDVEKSYIGGVCAGLGSFFNIDTTIIRIIWALFFFVGGMGLLLYIVLWILLPKANTTIDRLKMQGKPINVDTVKEEVERAAKNVSDKSRRFANSVANNENINNGVSFVVKLFKIFFGILFTGAAITAFVLLLVLIFGNTSISPALSNDSNQSLYEITQLVFANKSDVALAWLTVFLTFSSFIVFCSLAAIVLFFNIQNKWYRYINLVLVLTWIVGFSIGAIVISRTTNEYSNYGEVTVIPKKFDSEQLQIQINPFDKIQDNLTVRTKTNYRLNIGKDDIKSYGVKLEYRIAQDSLYEVRIKRTANSSKIYDASNKADNIFYNYELKNDTLILPNWFTFPKADKIRNQNVIIQIFIPRGKTVNIDGEIIDLQKPIEDDEDEHYTYVNIQSGKIRANGTYKHRID